ncbi:hypothetical protein GCWU000282_03037 [Catonella morbi ATCC 51271]|uniref:Uncharacterized protein n=1 Tax=Catonella morbi ATCC 51271 TaxID=592026 RepID=V2Z499_9FIRM|nr:hypothetical protein GCWU000282_03037 [Catonella morbi ATCC 51271]
MHFKIYDMGVKSICLHTLRARAVPQGKLPYRESGNTRRDFNLIENSEEISY